MENEADRIAADWVAHLDRHGGDENDHRDLKRWLEADTCNRGAFMRARAGWLLLSNASSAVDQFRPRQEPEGPVNMSRRAAIGALSGGALVLATASLVGLPAKVEAYSTGIGEVRRLQLAEGSVMTLDTNSRVETRLSSSRREVSVISGGAFFDVAPGAGLPLVVTDRHFRVDASKASFFVGTTPRSQVIVAAGDVHLRSVDKNGARHRLGPGKFAYTGTDGEDIVTNVSEDVIARRLAWREGGISLDGESVLEAAQRFNRYNRRQIVIDDAALARQEVVGWFRIDQPDIFAQTVASAFSGEIRGEGNTIRIVSRKKKLIVSADY